MDYNALIRVYVEFLYARRAAEEASYFRASGGTNEDAKNLPGSLDRDTNFIEPEKRESFLREEGRILAKTRKEICSRL